MTKEMLMKATLTKETVQRLWDRPGVRAAVYVALIVLCYLFGEFTRPFVYRDF